MDHVIGASGKSRDRAPRIFVIAAEYAILAVLAVLFLWRGFLPAWKTLNTDFVDYYLAAKLYRQHYPLTQIYDWSWVQRQKDHAGIDRPIVAFTSLTPFSLLPALPFSSLSPLSAKRGWLVVNLILLALAGWLLWRMSKLRWRRVTILVLLAIVPLRNSFLFGQQTVLLLFLFTLAAYLSIEHRTLASGLVLALAGALKIWPALFLIFFVRKKQWRAALGLISGSIALWLLSACLFGIETIRTYLVEVMPWSLRGEGQDPYNINWNSFAAVLHRLFIFEPELNPHPVAHLPALYSVLQPVCQGLIFVPFLWLMGSARAQDDLEKFQWGTFLAMLLILSTQAASYDFVILILTAALAVGYLCHRNRLREAAGIVALFGLVCFPLYRWASSTASGWATLLAVPRLWAMTALWIVLLVAVWRSLPLPERPNLHSREAVIFASIWLALVTPATVLNLLYMRHEFDNYPSRLAAIPESYLDTGPAVSHDDVLFTMMLNEGYRTGILRGGSLQKISSGSDAFHPAAAGPLAWVELAGLTSRVVRFPIREAAGNGFNSAVDEEDNAEKPSVSTDGRWLAFIRESRGEGTLWLKEIQQEGNGSPVDQAAKQISSADFDVLDAAFDAKGGIIFSARRSRGSPALFSNPRDSQAINAEDASAPRRYPAVSPDGHWLAFSQRDGGNWQLWMRDLATRAERRLTLGDCNSTAPAWYPDSKNLVYATDCGRSLGLTALCRIKAVP